MSQFSCFGLADDWRLLCGDVERQFALKYVLMQNETRPDLREFETAGQIEAIGIADAGTGSVCRSYLVAKRNARINVREFRGVGGERRCCVDQLINPDTITLTAAGLRSGGVILSGCVGTASDSPDSRELMRAFRKAAGRLFRKVRAFWIGPSAERAWQGGARLTISEHSPSEFDLAE